MRAHRLRISNEMKGHAHLRIAIFGQNSPDSYSGGRYHAWMTAEALSHEGNEVVVVTNNRPVFLQDFFLFPRHNNIQIIITRDFRTGLPDGPLDIVLVVPHKNANLDFYVGAEAFAKRSGARLVLMCFETPNWFNAMSPFEKDVELWAGWKYLSKSCSMILSISAEGKKYAREFFKECHGDTLFEHCHCCINSPVADIVPEQEREKRIVSMARFVFAEHKGCEELVSVFCEAMRGYTLVLMVGVGDIPPDIREAFETEAKRYGITLEIKFRLTDEEKFTELKRACLLIYLSRFEGFGLPPVEAQFCNVPCIAYDLPVLREVSGEGITYVSPGDYSAFKRSIAQVLSCPPGDDRLCRDITPIASFEAFSKRTNAAMERAMERRNFVSSIDRADGAAGERHSAPPIREERGRGSTEQRRPLWKRAASFVVRNSVHAIAANRLLFRVVCVLMRHDKWKLLRLVAESDDYRSIRSIATADNNKVLKTMVFEGEFALLRQLLAAGEWTPLRHVLFEKDSQRLKKILFAEDRKALKRILTEGDYRELRKFLDADSAAVLDKLLVEDDYARLQRSLFKDDYAALAKLADRDNAAPLRHLLYSNAYSRLKLLLFEDDPSVLRRVLTEGDREPLRQMLSADHGSLLKDFLFEDNYRLLEAILTEKEGYRALYGLLIADEADLLKRVLDDDEKQALKALLYADEFSPLREMLLTDDATPLRHLLFADDAELLKGILFDNDHRGLRRSLFDDNYQELRRVLRMDDSAPMRAVLLGGDKKELKEFLFDGEFSLLREMLLVGDATPLQHLLFADDAELLKRILFDEDQLGLREVLLHETYQEPRKLPDRDDSAVLRRLLFENDFARLKRLLYTNQYEQLRRLLRSDAPHTLISVLEEDNYELLHQFLAEHPETVLKDLVLRDEDQILKKLLINGAVLNEVFTNKRLDAARQFQESWLEIVKLIPLDSPEILGRYNIAKKSISDQSQVDEKLLDVIYEKGKLLLKKGDVEFPDRHSLVTLLHEILLNEDYYFKTETKSPRILDCGTHIGLGIYYFKNLYPKARITGFEPVPALRKLAMQNIQRSGFGDVEILPYALSAKDKQTTFYVSKEHSMAGSLVDRRRLMGDEVSEITVTCKKLSDYLKEPVHFLKLDIEGVEDEVLEEAKDFLSNVQYIFCEYHQGSGLGGDRLAKILSILEAAGFDVQIGKSHNFQNSSKYRPMNFVTGPYSGVMWAVNRNWTEFEALGAPKASKAATAKTKPPRETKARSKTTIKKKSTAKKKGSTKRKSKANQPGKATSPKKTKAKSKPGRTISDETGS